MAADQTPLIYLNNAATSWPKPPEVTAALAASLSLPPFGSGRTTGTQGDDYPSRAREKLSAVLGAPGSDNIIFTHNATAALNTLITGYLAGKPADTHVLTTALDHNSVLRPLHEHLRAQRIRLDVLPFENGYISPESVEAAILPETRLMVMTHASNVLGTVQDIRTIGTILRDHEIFLIVDGAQTAGHIPITLRDLPVDAFVFTGHKALLGIPGTGGFYLRNPDDIAPQNFGGTGTNSASLLHPREMPERFEAGTHNYPGLAALAAGITYLQTRGIRTIAQKSEQQTAYLISELKKDDRITLCHDHPDLPIISFNISGIPNDHVGFILARAYTIISRTGLHCAPLVHSTLTQGQGCVRLSLSCFTTDEECTITAHAIQEIAAHANSAINST